MLSGEQPCFQLLRFGSSTGDSARDLYTFRPAQSRSVFRLGRAAELCDVTLDSAAVSRIHAELYTERKASGGDEDEEEEEEEEQQEESWQVHIKDRSSHGTWLNDVRLQPGVLWELSDGDTLTFGGQSAPGSPESYFLFQKVKVRPLDFDAITIPKAGTFSSDLKNRIRTNLDRKAATNLDHSKMSIKRATVILNSIGSLSKMKGSAWTFQRSHSHEGTVSDPGTTSSSSPVNFTSLLPSSAPPSLSSAASAPSTKPLQAASRSRRKSAHTVLLEDDSSDEPRGRGALVGVVEDGQRARPKKRRRLYRSESEGFSSPPPPPLQPKLHSDIRRPLEAKPFPVGIRTIGSFHGAMTNSQLNPQLLQASFTNMVPHKQEVETTHRVKTVLHGNITTFRQQKPAGVSPMAQRGRRRANSTPVFSPLVVGGENYSLASPTVRVRTDERGRVQFNRFHHPTAKRRGRPRKHPPPPRPSLPSPSSSSSSSTSSASSSSGSSSSSSDDEDEDEVAAVGGMEPCAAPRCRLPQQDTVQWIQCDVCDAWYHIDCLHVDRKKLLKDPNADFHCGCR
ncbi:transcription factor 19 [Kryptolebias marmoratus]|uniref:Transcription factor 19 (SC1), like n=1 Tax=Kryptolebias marmoratus TaxID=37003 RepID=A0A3Q3H164_KRYMA|nr:transcription factor 19 [Kryptolebias marmoratus]XP_024864183.1 transcription factor 19 [Kryptolebias marmoratus]XP_037831638.1 transcription factor 19 [Kryptolebias marmoratus]